MNGSIWAGLDNYRFCREAEGMDMGRTPVGCLVVTPLMPPSPLPVLRLSRLASCAYGSGLLVPFEPSKGDKERPFGIGLLERACVGLVGGLESDPRSLAGVGVDIEFSQLSLRPLPATASVLGLEPDLDRDRSAELGVFLHVSLAISNSTTSSPISAVLGLTPPFPSSDIEVLGIDDETSESVDIDIRDLPIPCSPFANPLMFMVLSTENTLVLP